MRKTTKHGWLVTLAGTAAAAALVCAVSMAPVWGAEADDQKAPPAAAQSESATNDAAETKVTIGSVTVGVDPKTGDIRPLTAREAARLAREMNRLFKPRQLKRIENPDGSLSAIVAPNVLRFSVAKIEADGSVTRECAPGQEAALEFLTRAEPKAKSQREEK